MSQGPLAGISRILDATSHRISSYDKTGGNGDCWRLPAGETITLAEIDGAGIVKHLWFTLNSLDPMHKRNLVLRMYWDGQEYPSVESPIGDFFGNGWGMDYLFESLPLACGPKEGKALVGYWPMPFGRGARITLENQGPEDLVSLYFYIDYEKHASIPDDQGRFHAWYNQELTVPESEKGDIENEWAVFGDFSNNLSDRHNYVFAEIEGRGHFCGVNYYVNCPSPMWYGEGDDMFLVDGEPWPGSAHGTGTEDYFNMSWCPEEPFCHAYYGLALAPGFVKTHQRLGWMGRTHCYRFHLEDPIRFARSLRASIEHGHANCLTLELATVAYWYQTLPGKRFPLLPGVAERAPRREIGVGDIHKWRDAWRREKGGGAVWE